MKCYVLVPHTSCKAVVGVGGGLTKYKTWTLETGVPHVVRFNQQKHIGKGWVKIVVLLNIKK